MFTFSVNVSTGSGPASRSHTRTSPADAPATNRPSAEAATAAHGAGVRSSAGRLQGSAPCSSSKSRHGPQHVPAQPSAPSVPTAPHPHTATRSFALPARRRYTRSGNTCHTGGRVPSLAAFTR